MACGRRTPTAQAPIHLYCSRAQHLINVDLLWAYGRNLNIKVLAVCHTWFKVHSSSRWLPLRPRCCVAALVDGSMSIFHSLSGFSVGCLRCQCPRLFVSHGVEALLVTDPSFLPWLDYSAPHLVRNIGNIRYVDRPASLFSGEHVLSHGIYVVGSR